MTEEIWKVIGEAPRYSVSTLGRVRRDVNGRIRNNTFSRYGYPLFTLNGKHFHIHRLMAKAFIPKPDWANVVDHIDGDRANNVITNLRWATQQMNLLNRHAMTSQSGHVGVTRSGRKNFPWLAYGKVNQKFVNLGRFKLFEEAAQRRRQWESEVGCTTSANLGFPAHGTKKKVIDLRLIK